MRHISTIALAASLFTVNAVHAVPLFSDSFDSEVQGLNQSLDNWTVTDGTIDVVGTGFFNFYPGNGNYLDLDGSTGNAGIITTNVAFNLLPGLYTLSFQLGGNARNGGTDSVTVSLGSVFNEVFTLAGNAGLQNITRSFSLASAAGTAALSFNHAGGDNVGLLLDDVLLDFSRVSTAVPEPSSMALLSVAGLLAARRGRRVAG
ncbi:MAG: PEP-CTERM sorting domain-containing protein [Gammaproteobacteria bacterium]|nr:PEP-CTERM sorting domain-containing protein [Gammaproteobacteria bacterium]